jgi:hypothetical protein
MPLPLSSVEKVILAKREMVPSWLLSGYEELVEEQNLTLQATDKLDWETTARLFFVQKQILGNPEVCSGNHAKNCYYCGRNNQSVCCIQNANREVCKVHELLREVFEGELRGMEVVETT